MYEVHKVREFTPLVRSEGIHRGDIDAPTWTPRPALVVAKPYSAAHEKDVKMPIHNFVLWDKRFGWEASAAQFAGGPLRSHGGRCIAARACRKLLSA
jgi:hypothetical protein